jgi:hypothetical protein
MVGKTWGESEKIHFWKDRRNWILLKISGKIEGTGYFSKFLER